MFLQACNRRTNRYPNRKAELILPIRYGSLNREIDISIVASVSSNEMITVHQAWGADENRSLRRDAEARIALRGYEEGWSGGRRFAKLQLLLGTWPETLPELFHLSSIFYPDIFCVLSSSIMGKLPLCFGRKLTERFAIQVDGYPNGCGSFLFKYLVDKVFVLFYR